MGTRLNIVLANENRVAAVLFSNSCHPEVDAELIVRTHAAAAKGLTELATWLLSNTYPSTVGPNWKDYPVFSLDAEPGDHEKVLLVSLTVLGSETSLVVEDLGDIEFEAKLHKPGGDHE